MGTKLGESADLFDVDTGKWVGALDAHGRSVIVDNGIRVVLSGAATVYIGHTGY